MSDLMWEKGYAATSPREVRDRSGVGQGSMYHHFPSKRELALAALERNCQDLLPGSIDPLSAPGDPLEKLAGHMSTPRDALKGCKVGRMTQDPLVATDPGLLAPVTDAFEKVHTALVAVIREAIDAGELPAALDPDRIASLLQATIQGGYVLAIARQDRAPYDEAVAGVVDLLRAAAPPPAAAPASAPTTSTPTHRKVRP
ncbi:TetR family transcriptional regulator [Raineyella fluvialis]|uniref:TetR family transcriptional regulator n=2 Tax=Raineyella fluvialis TaxID=2662261 RepID=A0A5Q2FDR5_9ACTN|nr:TetR family transcriptional regulator [Raineyella fluvialis]